MAEDVFRYLLGLVGSAAAADAIIKSMTAASRPPSTVLNLRERFSDPEYTVVVQPPTGPKGPQPMVVNRYGDWIVDPYGTIQNPAACPPGQSCVGQKTQTAGIQEAINYVYNTYGGGKVFIRSGTYQLSKYVNILNGNIMIIGENKFSTVITNPTQTIFNVLTSNVEIANLTLQDAGEYFILTQPTQYGQVIENIYYHDLRIIGGNSIGTGQFMFIDNVTNSSGQVYSQTMGNVDFKHVLLERIYINTEGKTGANEILDFLNIQPVDFKVRDLYIEGTQNYSIEFGLFGGEITLEDVTVVSGNMVLGASNNPTYVTLKNVKSLPWVSSTEGYPLLQLAQNTNTNGYMPIFLKVSGRNPPLIVAQVNNTPYPLIEELDIEDAVYDNPNIGNIIYNVAAKVINISHVTFPQNFGSAYSGIGQIAPGIALPPLSLSATINVNLEDVLIGYPNNNQGYANVIGFNSPASSSATVKYAVRISGQFPLSGSNAVVIVNGNGYPTFWQAVLSNPNLFLYLDVDATDSTTGTYYKMKIVPGLSVSTPSVPSSGSAAQNTYQFPVLVYLYGGTVTEVQITRNGNTYTVFSNSSGVSMSGQAFRLDPGDSITISYSSAPSWVWVPV